MSGNAQMPEWPKTYEGHWRHAAGEDSKLPWPVPDPAWPGTAAFLRALDAAEAKAIVVDFMGISKCRLCGRANGSSEFRLRRWGWPEGYRHYIADHQVRPSPEFERFVKRLASPREP
jgi:hypothetical protein